MSLALRQTLGRLSAAVNPGREHGISAATFYQWKSKFGGMDVSEGQESSDFPYCNRYLDRRQSQMAWALSTILAGSGTKAFSVEKVSPGTIST